MNTELGSDVDFAEVVTDHMQDAAVVINPDQEIIYVNHRLAAMLPEPSAVIGKNAVTSLKQMATDPSDVEQYATALEAVLTDGDDESVTIPVSLASEERILDLRLTPYRQDDHIVGVVIIARDITEREQLKDQLLYLNQLLRHDIRNDLLVANGYAELIAEEVSEYSDELENIISASKHGIELTQTARDFIRSITDEGTPADLTPVEITELIEAETEQVSLIYP